MSNPYLVSGPALISFSGGRTSAYMLHEILAAHGGTLPEDVIVTFANTGKEREETLRFVHECETNWGVKVHWLEWRPPAKFEEVGYNSADRSGQWFAELIRRKQYLPNSQMRYANHSQVGELKMSGKVLAPWSAEQVEKLREWQACDWVHPFTCPNHGDGVHARYRAEAQVPDALIVDEIGWICEWCGYKQDWAHDFMLLGAPENPLDLIKGS